MRSEKKSSTRAPKKADRAKALLVKGRTLRGVQNGHARRAVVPLKERRLNFGAQWEFAPAPEDNKYLQIAPKHDLFINGRFVAPRAGKYFPSINPATEEKLTEIASGGEA